MSRHATISLVSYKPVPGDDPSRLDKTLAKMGTHVDQAAALESDSTGGAPIVTATLDLERRLLHPNFNLDRLKPLYEKYGPTAAYAERIPEECLLIFGSQLPDVSTDELIEEFGIEPMRDYLARVRRDRQRALDGTYKESQ